MNNKQSMLIVDDVKVSRTLIKGIFRNSFNFLEAENGKQALELIIQNHVDIIILDIIMPIMDGFEMIRKLKASKRFFDIPIVVVTSLSDKENETRLADLGIHDIVYKPLEPEILKDKVQTILQLKALQKKENDNLYQNNLLQIQLDAIKNRLSFGVGLLEFGAYVRLISINSIFYQYFEMTTIPEDIMTLVHPDDQSLFLQQMKKAIDSYTPCYVEFRVIKPNGQVFWQQCQAVEIEYSESNLPVMLCIFSDVTKLKEIEQNLMETSIQLSTLINNVPCGYAIYEFKNNVLRTIYGNNRLYQMYGINKPVYDTTIGKDLGRYVYEGDVEEFYHAIREGKNTGESITINFRTKNFNNKVYWNMLKGQFISISDEEPVLYALVLDITQQKKFELELFKRSEEIRYRADHDELTGIYNRSAFIKATTELLNENPSTKYVMFRLNIEKFRLFNELFGSEEANEILIKISRVLLRELDGIGTYGRIETDHFIGCVPEHLFDPEKFLLKLQKKIMFEKNFYQIKIDMGMYEIDDLSLPVEVMFDRAYLALQTIKGKYDQKYAYYDQKLRDQMLEEQEIENEMHLALETNQFTFYLQPIYSLNLMEPYGAEALVRWIHPRKGIISPNKFISLFEKNGFIFKLDFFIWEKTCEYISYRYHNGLAVFPISVNISRVSFYQKDLAEKILSLTNKYNISPSLLHLEITETAYNNDPKQFLEILSKLREYGFAISLDDFGSGYSSLNALKDIPIDIIKIDMKFMENVDTSTRASTVLMSIIRMAKWLNIPVIVEGVERLSQVDYLKSIGCDYVQGYYFNRPLPIDEFEKKFTDRFVNNDNNTDYFTIDEINVFFTGDGLLSKIMNNFYELFGIYELVDDKFYAIRINNRFYEIMGYTVESYFRMHSDVNNYIHPEDIPKFISSCKKAFINNTPQRQVIRNYHANGNIVYIDTIFRALAGNEERMILFLTGHDITLEVEHYHQIQELNEEIRLKDQYLMATFDEVSYPLMILNSEDNFESCKVNRSMLELLKLPLDDPLLNIRTLNLKNFMKNDEIIKMNNIICKMKKSPTVPISLELIDFNKHQLEVLGTVEQMESFDHTKKIIIKVDK